MESADFWDTPDGKCMQCGLKMRGVKVFVHEIFDFSRHCSMVWETASICTCSVLNFVGALAELIKPPQPLFELDHIFFVWHQ